MIKVYILFLLTILQQNSVLNLRIGYSENLNNFRVIDCFGMLRLCWPILPKIMIFDITFCHQLCLRLSIFFGSVPRTCFRSNCGFSLLCRSSNLLLLSSLWEFPPLKLLMWFPPMVTDVMFACWCRHFMCLICSHKCLDLRKAVFSVHNHIQAVIVESMQTQVHLLIENPRLLDKGSTFKII